MGMVWNWGGGWFIGRVRRIGKDEGCNWNEEEQNWWGLARNRMGLGGVGMQYGIEEG